MNLPSLGAYSNSDPSTLAAASSCVFVNFINALLCVAPDWCVFAVVYERPSLRRLKIAGGKGSSDVILFSNVSSNSCDISVCICSSRSRGMNAGQRELVSCAGSGTQSWTQNMAFQFGTKTSRAPKPTRVAEATKLTRGASFLQSPTASHRPLPDSTLEEPPERRTSVISVVNFVGTGAGCCPLFSALPSLSGPLLCSNRLLFVFEA
jgi:hypothetical protein